MWPRPRRQVSYRTAVFDGPTQGFLGVADRRVEFLVFHVY